uniref:MAK10-like protein n=1 Tax=Tanacetum cinerariifolium TaxID=118510 RepID=A0A6L2K6P0_TANCI|nr:MAK10-like protein [Tanacetum cinerariifolium]
MENGNPIPTLGDYSKPSHEGYQNTIEILVGNNVVPLRSDTIRLVQNGCPFHGLWSDDPNQHLKDFLKLVESLDLDVVNRERARSISTWEDLTTCFLAQFFPPGRTAKLCNDILMFQQHQGESTIDQSASGKLRDRNAKESSALLEDLAFNDNESWNDPRDFAKSVKAISLSQDSSSSSDRRLIELNNHVQRLMDAHLAPKQSVQGNKITSSCEICSGPHDTQYCLENLEQAFVDYVSSYTDEAGGKCSINAIAIYPKQPSKPYDDKPVENEIMKTGATNKDHHAMVRVESERKKSKGKDREEEGNTENINTDSPSQPDLSISFITEKVCKLNSFLETPGLVPQSSDTEKDIDRGVSNFTGRIKGMYIFEGNFTYVAEFMIIKDISSIIDPRFSQVVLEKPFVEISNMTHDLSLGVVKFTNGINEIAYKMPHKIEQYKLLLDLEKEHTKSIYLRNEEEKRKKVEYVMNKILGFYKECLELGPKYLTGVVDEREVT